MPALRMSLLQGKPDRHSMIRHHLYSLQSAAARIRTEYQLALDKDMFTTPPFDKAESLPGSLGIFSAADRMRHLDNVAPLMKSTAAIVMQFLRLSLHQRCFA